MALFNCGNGCDLSYYVQLVKMPMPVIYVLVGSSIMLGLIAGVSLLML